MLGRGGFSTVWAAELAGRAVALKLSHRATDAALARATTEAAALTQLAGLRAPQLLDRGVYDGRPYLVMSQVAGRPLRDLLGTGDLELRTIGTELAAALATLHEAGVVHGDLSPSNVVLDGDAITFLDFGSAVTAGAAAAAGTTIAYTAPERIRGAPASAAGDIYALGAMLYELAAGRPPFLGDPRLVMHGHLLLRPSFAGLAPIARAAIARCLAKEPAARPTARALARELGAGPMAGTRLPSHVPGATTGRIRRECVVVVAELRAAISSTARTIAEHGGELLWFRGERVTAAWHGHDAAPRAVTLARVLHHELAARATIGLATIPCDPRSGELQPDHELEAPDWVPPRWHGVLGTAPIARALHLRVTDGALCDLTQPRRADLAGPPLIGRDRELAVALAHHRDHQAAGPAAVLLVMAEPGLGKTRFAYALASALAATTQVALLSGRGEPDAAAIAARALVIDDADAAGDRLLDALAARAREPGWIALIGGSTTAARVRSVLDHGAGRGSDAIILLPALDDHAAAAVLEHALEVERLPDVLRRRLLALAGGRPAFLIELAAHLERTGAVQTASGLSRRFVAGDAIDVPAHGGEAWLADAQLAALPMELRTVAAIAGVLEPGFELAELEAAVESQERASFDPGLAVVELATRQLVVGDANGWRFASPALARAAAKTLGEPHAVHRAVLELAARCWDGQLDVRRRRAIARHVAATGDPLGAAGLVLALADDARRAHRDGDAETDYTAALAAIPDGRSIARARGLLGRGTVRYRLDRARDAAIDLDAAQAMADALGDPDTAARAGLELATALDWLGRYADSAQAAQRAGERIAGLPIEARRELACGLAMARGRSALRAGRAREAAALLTEATEAPASLATDDDRVIALVLLGPVEVQLGGFDAAEATFADALALADRMGDSLARCAALGNRVALWSARGDHDRARADLVSARDLARLLGHAVPERNATYNLAEYLYWSGSLDEALRLAERSRDLQHRLVGRAFEDDLLIARITAALGDAAAARAALSRCALDDLPPALALIAGAVHAFLARSVVGFVAIERTARAELVGEELAEVFAWRLATHRAAGVELPGRDAGSALQAWRWVQAPAGS